MKRLLLLAVVLLIAPPAYSQVNLGTSTSATNPQRSGDATTGLFSATTGAVSVSSVGTEMMRVNGTGVGIETTSPGAELNVKQIGNAFGYGIRLTNTLSNNWEWAMDSGSNLFLGYNSSTAMVIGSSNGTVSIGTTVPVTGALLTVNGGLAANALILNSLPVPLPAGGRLTLSSNTPVMTADVTGATTVYYADYVSDLVPIYNGSSWIEYSLGGQISLALDSNSGHTGYQQSGYNFDLFVGLNSSTLELCTGPAWSSSSSRGTGAGTTQIQLVNGIWTNENSMTCRFGNSSANTFTCAANQCTLLGSMYATGNGQTGVKCSPTGAAGGTSSIIGVSNAYNQVPISCSEADTTSSGWTYATASWRVADNSTANSVVIISTLAQGPITLAYGVSASNNTIGDATSIGVSQIDSQSAVLNFAQMSAPTATTADNYQQLFAYWGAYAQLGYHTYYPLEKWALRRNLIKPKQA